VQNAGERCPVEEEALDRDVTVVGTGWLPRPPVIPPVQGDRLVHHPVDEPFRVGGRDLPETCHKRVSVGEQDTPDDAGTGEPQPSRRSSGEGLHEELRRAQSRRRITDQVTDHGSKTGLRPWIAQW
jgi:hypothetical protein